MRLIVPACAAAFGLAAPLSPLLAQETIATEETDPVVTSEVDGLEPGETLELTVDGSVTVGEGQTAVTLDTDNEFINEGLIDAPDADNAVGVRALGGADRSLVNNGSIQLLEDYTPEDTDEDNEVDGPFALGSGRIGILIEGDEPFGGDVTADSTARITVEGNDSYGILATTDIDGEFVNDGITSVRGNRSTAILLEGNIAGDVIQSGATSAAGEDAQGIVLRGDVAGGFENSSSVAATGFRSTATSNYFDPDLVSDDFEPISLDEGDDLLTGGPAVSIGGDLAQGFLNQGTTGEASLDNVDDDGDGIRDDDDLKDTFGDYDVNRTSGSISSFGSAPALLISPDVDPDGTDDLVIATVEEEIRDTLDDDADDDTNEVIATFTGNPGEDYDSFNGLYAVINRGTITGTGLNVGYDANAVTIIGSSDGGRSVIIQGGLMNSGTISTSAREADATTMLIGDGASLVPLDDDNALDNAGTIAASTFTEDENTATAISIAGEASVPSLTNFGVISSTVRGDDGSGYAIVDESGTLSLIENSGIIFAVYSDDLDDDDGDGLGETELDDDERTGEMVALDLSQNTSGVTIQQTRLVADRDINGDDVIDENDVINPTITGEVRLGAGDDLVDIAAGFLSGDISFGDGVNTLVLSGDADMLGDISSAATGSVAVTLSDDARLALANDGQVRLASLTVNDNARLAFEVDLANGGAESAAFDVSGAAVIADGGSLAPRITGIGVGEAEVVLLSAADLTLAGGDVSSILAEDTSFLYDTSLRLDEGDTDTIVAVLELKQPDELGMQSNQAAAYDAWIAAMSADDEVGTIVASLSSQDSLLSAYDQFLPDYSAAAARFALAHSDGAVGAVANRLDIVRGGRESAGAVWLQEFITYADREATDTNPGYRGNGFGLAAGVDRPFGPFYATGLNFVAAASQFEQHTSFDDPLSVISGQLGFYAASALGPVLLDIYGGAGIDQYDSTRVLTISPDDEQLETLERTTDGSWTGYHYAGSARLGVEFEFGRLFARPGVSVDYLRLDEDSYVESGGGTAIDLEVFDRNTELFSATSGLVIGGMFGSPDSTWWSPRLRVGYRNEFSADTSPIQARFVGLDEVFTLRPEDLPETGTVYGFSFAAGSRYSSFSFDYDVDSRDGYLQHIARIGFRFLF